MSISDRTYSVVTLALSGLGIFYMLFILIIVPILPLDEDNILRSFSPARILLAAGLMGLIFIGSLSVFTICVMCNKPNWDIRWPDKKK